MALLWFDGFDHYGLDETKLTEGPYDQVDVAFTLSEVNPRTGARCLRRDDSAVDGRVLKSFSAPKVVVGSGFAITLSSLPTNDGAYALAALVDSMGLDQITLVVNADGSVRALLGDVDGTEIAASEPSVVNASRYHHIEFACIANTEDPDVLFGILTFSENFENDLDDYTSEKPQFYSVVSTPFGNGIKCTNVEVSTSNDSAFRSIPSNEYSRITFYAIIDVNVPGPESGDADIAQFSFANSGTSIISGVLSRDATATGSNERLIINGNFIGSTKLTVGEWYFFEFDLDWDLGTFDFSVTGETEGLFSSGSFPFSTSNPINQLRFGVDVASGERLNDAGTFADLDFFLPGTVIGDSNGIIETRVDGVTVISESGIATRLGDEASYSGITLNCGSSASHGVITDIDDFFIWDDTGAWNNSFLGDKRALLRSPNADTVVSDFEPSSGDFGYQMIDEDSPEEDATFILAESALLPGSPPSGSSEFGIQNLPNGVSHIAGVSVFTRAAKTDSDTAEIFTSVISGVNSVSGSPHELSESYGYHIDLYEYDPATIANFTKGGFDLSLVSLNAELAPGPGSPEGSPGAGSPGAGSPGDEFPTSELIAHYTMDNISGSTLLDETGNFDLTINGAVNTEPGVFGDALTMNGTTNYANGAITLGNAFTVCGWVHLDNLSSTKSIVAIGTGSLPSRIFVTAAGTLFVSVNDGAGGFATASFSGLVGTDAFICAVWRGNGNTMQISVNDGTPGTAAQTQDYSNKSNLLIGARRTTDFSDKMVGWVDQFRVYDRALTAEEITQVFEE